MPTGPVENTLEQCLPRPFLAPEPVCQRRSFSIAEVFQFDPPPDVKRRGTRVLDEVGGGSNAKQTEGQPSELRVQCPAVVAFADRGEEFIRRERQAADVVDLVNKNDDT